MDLHEKRQLDRAEHMARVNEHVARVKAHTRPWRSIIAAALAIAAGVVASLADTDFKDWTGRGHYIYKIVAAACIAAFVLFASAATVGMAGKGTRRAHALGWHGARGDCPLHHPAHRRGDHPRSRWPCSKIRIGELPGRRGGHHNPARHRRAAGAGQHIRWRYAAARPAVRGGRLCPAEVRRARRRDRGPGHRVGITYTRLEVRGRHAEHAELRQALASAVGDPQPAASHRPSRQRTKSHTRFTGRRPACPAPGRAGTPAAACASRVTRPRRKTTTRPTACCPAAAALNRLSVLGLTTGHHVRWDPAAVTDR